MTDITQFTQRFLSNKNKQ